MFGRWQILFISVTWETTHFSLCLAIIQDFKKRQLYFGVIQYKILKSFIPPLLPVLLGDKEVPGKMLSQSPGLILLSSKKLFF